MTAENCSSIIKDVHAESGGTVNITITGADCTGTAGAKLRVTYFWLDNYATGHVVAGYLPPSLRQALGHDLPVVQNAVFKEVQALFDRFGVALDIPSDEGEGAEVAVCYQSGEADEYGDPIQECDMEDVAAYGRDLQASGSASSVLKVLPDPDFFIPLPEAEEVLATTDGWPEDFNFSYISEYDAEDIRYAVQAHEQPNTPSFVLWRGAAPDELANLRSRLRAYAREFVEGALAGLLISQFPYSRVPPESRADRESAAGEFLSGTDDDISVARFFEFISGGDLPSDLAYVYLDSSTCDGIWQFHVAGPQQKLLVAVVENAGSEPVTVTALDVLTDERGGLRPLAGAAQEPDDTWRAETLPLPQQTFRPGEAVLVPLRIEFHATGPYPLQATGAATYAAIRELPPGTRLRVPNTEVTKTAGGFGPHADLPQQQRFVFGPEIVLRAARLGAQQVALRQIDPTAISMWVGYAIGSCPYVYGYDASHEQWRLQSRAVVGATRRELAYEDSFPLEHFDGRLRIAEIEPEVSFLDDITVEVALADGSMLRLFPDDARLQARDSRYLLVAYPEAAEIRFPGFDEIEMSITGVTARVFGYYREFGILPRTVSSRAAGPMCRRLQTPL